MADLAFQKARVINDDFRSAAFNRKYYGCLLARWKRINLTFEITIAVGSSAAVAAWNLWQVGPATYVWKVLAALATLMAVVKPFLGVTKNIERYSELVAGWAELFYDLKRVTVRMRTTGAIEDATWSSYEPTQQRVKELSVKDDPEVDKRLQRRCFEETKLWIPPDTLWWPEESEDGRSRQAS